MKQLIVISFCLFPLLVAARPTTSGGAVRQSSSSQVTQRPSSLEVYRPTTQITEFHPSSLEISVQRPVSANTVVSHPTTPDTPSRPVTTVSVVHPTTSVGAVQSPTEYTFPAPKSMESYMTAGKGSSSGSDSKEKKNGLPPAKDFQKATSFSPNVEGFAQTPENVSGSAEFENALARIEEAKKNLKDKEAERFRSGFEDAIKNKAKSKAKGQGGQE